MDVTESYRILELEIGASRAAVDAAYCRLVEKWHPDRASSDDPKAVQEAQRMVQAINEAHQTLVKISPGSNNSASPASLQNTDVAGKETGSEPAKPATAAPSNVTATPLIPKTKPRLPPMSGGQPTLGHQPPPPPPPPPGSWNARSSVTSNPPPPATVSPLPTTKPGAAPAPADRPPVSSVPAAAPPANRTAPPPEPSPAPSPLPSRKLPGLYDSLFPVGSTVRRFGPLILVALVAVAILVGKCTLSSSRHKTAQAADPKTTGRIVAKSNLAEVTITANRVAEAGDVSTGNFSGSTDQALSGLPPGKYSVVAHAERWPEIREEVTVEAERTTEINFNFKGGSLRFDSDPTGATVRLGAVVLGRTPLLIPQLPPGPCQLTVEYPFWPFATFNTTITVGQESTGAVRLPHGKLIVETAVPGTTVLHGRRVLGKTPLTVEQFPAGTRKLTLEAKDFPAMEVPITLEDRGEVKIRPALGAVFPVLDPAVLLRSAWVRVDEDRLAPPLEGVTGPFQARNGIVRNLNRKLLFETWLQKRYRITATVKAYDAVTGQVECTEQQSELSKYRILALLAPEVRNDPELIGQLTKGASLSIYGRLSAVEEPRWPSKVISLEFSSAYPLR